jgi:hypothetical protein
MQLEINIERLSLHGLPAVSTRQLGAALARELTRLVADGGLPDTLAADVHRPRLRSPGPPLPAAGTARLSDAPMVRGLARNIYRSLDQLNRPMADVAPAAQPHFTGESR